MKPQETQIQEKPEPLKAVLISQSDLESVLAKLTASVNKKWLTLKESASYLRISEISLRNFIRHKKISYYKIEGKLLFKITELDKFIEQNKIESVSDLIQKSVNGRK